MANSRTITFECPEDLLEDLEDRIEESVALENRSQAIRAGIRLLVEDPDDEFSRAQ